VVKSKRAAAKSSGAKPILPFPDPKYPRPSRPFNDPGWNEAWWWLGVPVFVAVFVVATHTLAPDWYDSWVLPEGYGILEISHFIMPVAGLIIASSLLMRPFVKARPLTFAVTLIGALSCLYIAGEEVSWGQHFFHWNTPEYWTEVNRQAETNLHNTYAIFEKTPRAILQIGIVIGGIILPLVALFHPAIRVNRLSLFIPADALAPTAIGMVIFKALAVLYERGVVGEIVGRGSETVETYLYFFILAYLIVFARRIHALEAETR